MKNVVPVFIGLVLIVLGVVGCSRSSTPELHVFIWSDYLKPELIEKFEKACGCRVVIDTYDSNESMYAKLKLGASAGYDVIFPSNYFLDIMVKQNMLQEINPSLIPNNKNIDPVYQQLAGNIPIEYGSLTWSATRALPIAKIE